ncbi:MAG: nucleoside triphosphate pyrophosphohydrolase [Oscillospiraceae bacterium]
MLSVVVEFNQKASYDISDLLQIVALLRKPDGGCPWDIKQTHESIKMNFIEETYEAADAIEQKDAHLLCEELGDVLLQIALHAQMEAEKASFTFSDVCDGICKKLIYRHPHVFGDVTASTSAEVLHNWEVLKRAEKGRQAVADNLNSVPKNLPALIRAEKLGKRAGDYGFKYADTDAALAQLELEIAELREAIASGEQSKSQEELGDVLFSTVNVARHIKVNAEEALTLSSDKFVKRLVKVQQLATESGTELAQLSPQQADALWRKAKESFTDK